MRTCFEKHPELKQQAQEHAKEKKKTKRLAALSTTPAEAGDSVEALREKLKTVVAPQPRGGRAAGAGGAGGGDDEDGLPEL